MEGKKGLRPFALAGEGGGVEAVVWVVAEEDAGCVAGGFDGFVAGLMGERAFGDAG